MRNLIAAFGGLLLCASAVAQGAGDNWEVYIGKYKNGPGSVTVDMGLSGNDTLRKSHPYLLVFTINAKDCDAKGFPTADEFVTLYKMADSVEAVVKTTPRGFLAGTFTNDCYYQCYYYMADTALLRPALQVMLQKYFPLYVTNLRIEGDPTYHAYQNFLYPTPAMQDYIADQKVILQLRQLGDNLQEPHRLEHFLYFKTKEDRERFIHYARSEGFSIEHQMSYDRKWELPFELRIYKTQMADIESVQSTTKVLRKKAAELNGQYDGWQTGVIKAK